jgi:ribosomal protein S11
MLNKKFKKIMKNIKNKKRKFLFISNNKKYQNRKKFMGNLNLRKEFKMKKNNFLVRKKPFFLKNWKTRKDLIDVLKNDYKKYKNYKKHYRFSDIIKHLKVKNGPLKIFLYLTFLQKFLFIEKKTFKKLTQRRLHPEYIKRKYGLSKINHIFNNSLSSSYINFANPIYKMLINVAILCKLRNKYIQIEKQKKIDRFSKMAIYSYLSNLGLSKFSRLFKKNLNNVIINAKSFVDFILFFNSYFKKLGKNFFSNFSKIYRLQLKKKLHLITKSRKGKGYKRLRKKKSFFRKKVYNRIYNRKYKKKRKFFRFIKNRKILKIHKRKSFYFLIIRAFFNNTFLTVINRSGKTLFKSSAGMNGYKGPKRTTFIASLDNATLIANKFSEYYPKFKKQRYELIGKRLKKRKKNLTIVLKSSITMSNVIAAVKGFNPIAIDLKFQINKIISKLCRPYNGCKPRKARRV